MIEGKCSVCGRTFYGTTQTQVDNNIVGHMNTHKDA